MSRCKHCSTVAEGPRSRSVSFPLPFTPASPPLYSYSKRPKVSSSDASYAGKWPQTIAYTSLTVPRSYRDLGHSLPEWVELFEPS